MKDLLVMTNSQSSIFVLGDSISIGYGPYLQAFLGESFAYDRKRDTEPGIAVHLNGENGEDSRKVWGYLHARIENGSFTPDILLLNCGLHDLRRAPDADVYQVPLANYEQNLRAIAALAQAQDLDLVWVRTTPVDDARHAAFESTFRRFDADVQRYNACADAVMDAANVPIIDLYGLVRALDGEIYVDHVHYTPRVAQLQGAYIAGFIRGMAG